MAARRSGLTANALPSGAGFRRWKVNSDARRRRWRKQQRSWCCEKKPRRSGGRARPNDQRPRSPAGRGAARGGPPRGRTLEPNAVELSALSVYFHLILLKLLVITPG